jgi:hypothetical protein
MTSKQVGIAQGTTPTCVHISEIGDYANPKRVLEEGLFPACHPTKSLFMVLEGKQIDRLLAILDRAVSVAERWADTEYPKRDANEEAEFYRQGEVREPQTPEEYAALTVEKEGRFAQRFKAAQGTSAT